MNRAQWQVIATLTDEQALTLSTCTAENLENMRAWCADAGIVLCNGEPYPFDDPSFSEPAGVWSATGTIVVNGQTVAAPVPVGYAGKVVFVAAPALAPFYVELPTSDPRALLAIERGTAHYTAANAIAHAEAMLLTGGA